MKTSIVTFLIVSLFSTLPSLAQIALTGTVEGYHNGEEVVIEYDNENSESGVISTFIDANGVFTAIIPLDPAVAGAFDACADICSFGVTCHTYFWEANQNEFTFNFYTCTSESVVVHGMALNMEYPDAITLEDIGGDGSSTLAYVQDGGYFGASVWVTPAIAGSMQVSWIGCDNTIYVDTLHWTEPDTTYNIAINGCPDPGNTTKVSISGVIQGLLTPINLKYSGNGFTDQMLGVGNLEGNYALILYNMPASGSEDICFVDCTGTEQCTTVSWSEGNTDIIQNFDYCINNNPAPCSAEFEVMDYDLYQEPNTVYIILPETYAVSYMWDFGDESSYSFDQFATHVYPWEGTFSVCLNVICADGTYQDFCQEITLNSDGSVDGGGSAMQPFTLYVIGAPTAVGEIESSLAEMKIYPNPSEDRTVVTWACRYSHAASLTLLNSIGQVISQEKIISREGINTHLLDVTTLESGYYIVKVENEAGQSITSVLIR